MGPYVRPGVMPRSRVPLSRHPPTPTPLPRHPPWPLATRGCIAPVGEAPWALLPSQLA